MSRFNKTIGSAAGENKMKPPEIIRTPRLTLRRPEIPDAEAIFKTYAQDRDVTQFLPWRPHRNIEETRACVQSRVDAWQEGTDFTWAIILSDGRLIGGISIRVREFTADVGYVIARQYWGKGYGTEALRALIEWVMQQPGLFRVWAVCDVENIASARVMEKVGMKREGILRRWVMHPQVSDTPRDCLCYSLVKD